MTTPNSETLSTKSAGSPAVIPAGDVVILREGELDTDLATAIERVRSNRDTQRSRILIVGPDSEVERQTGSEEAGLPAPAMPVSASQLGRLRETSILADVGRRFEALVDCLDGFNDEIMDFVTELEESAVEAPRARIRGGVRRIREVLAWTREVAIELRAESEHACEGKRRCDAFELAREAGMHAESFFPRIRVHCELDGSAPRVAARSAELVEALFLGFVLTAHRIGGVGVIQVSCSIHHDQCVVSITGVGEPRSVHAADLVERFRQIVQGHGGAVSPSAHGAAGTGLELRLPLASRG